MAFDSVGFCVFGIPAYFFCTGVGLVVAICTYIMLLYSKKYPLSQNMKVLIIAVIGLMIFAKLFGFISGIYRAIGVGEKVTFDTIKNTGIVFYGGLFGLVLIYTFGIKSNLTCEKDYFVLDILATIVPLFHAISRVGCFLSGCCFGMEWNGVFSVEYTTLISGIEDTSNRIPVQLLEAIFNLIVFTYLFQLLQKDNWKQKHILIRYLLIYSCGRFILEFIRGDIIRGIVYGISFSQLISIFIWMTLIFLVKKCKNISKKEEII